MFPAIADVAVMSIILLLALFLPRYRRPIVVALLVVLIMLLLVPEHPRLVYDRATADVEGCRGHGAGMI